MKTSNKTDKQKKIFNKNKKKGEIKMLSQKTNSNQKTQNTISLKKLRKGNFNMKPKNLFNLHIKSMMMLLFLLLSGQSLFSQLIKFYDFPPVSSSFSRMSSIEKVALISDGWSMTGYTNSPAGSGTKWLFQKSDAAGSVISTTLLGEPVSFGSQNCWSHALLTSTDYNVLAGVYKGTFILNGELFGEGAFTILGASGDPVITKRVAISPPLTVSTWRQVISVPDSYFTLTGSQVFNPSSSVYIPKVIAASYSSSGSMLWGYSYNLYSTLARALGHSICLAGDGSGNYYITGQIYLDDVPPLKPYIFVLKLSPAGIPIWAHVYMHFTPTEYSDAMKIIGLPDGDVVVAGSTNVYESSPDFRDMCVLRLHPDGAPVWSHTFGTTGISEEAMSVIYQSSDASLILTGYSGGTADGHTNLNLAKIDAASGIPIWMKFYDNPGGYDRGMDLKSFSGNRVTGYIHKSGSPAGSFQTLFMKTDTSGTAGSCLMSTPIPWNNFDINTQQVQDQFLPIRDSVIVVPAVHILPVVSSCGLTGINPAPNELPKTYSLLQNYPNPFNPSTNIKYQVAGNTYVKLVIYDITGKVVATLVDKNQNTGNYEVTFDANNLASGVYFYKITAGEFTDVKKMLLVK